MEDTGLLKLETSDLERGAKRISMPEDTGSYCSVKLETSELEIKAKNILEYTGLSGHQLELKLKSFSDHHGRKLISYSRSTDMIVMIFVDVKRST